MLKIGPGVVNGDIISDLIALADEAFANPFIQPFARSMGECQYCIGGMDGDGKGHHENDCPVLKYQEIAAKHPVISSEI